MRLEDTFDAAIWSDLLLKGPDQADAVERTCDVDISSLSAVKGCVPRSKQTSCRSRLASAQRCSNMPLVRRPQSLHQVLAQPESI